MKQQITWICVDENTNKTAKFSLSNVTLHIL